MRHHNATNKLGRTRAHRDAMLANMAASLLRHGRVETTLPKAKALRGMAERVVTLGKRGTVAARRRAIAIVRDRKAVAVAFDDLAKRFAARQGGYTRILKMGWRHGDSAPMAAIEYLARTEGEHAEAAPAEHKKEKGAKHAAKPAIHGGKAAARAARPASGKKPKPARGGAKRAPASRARKSGRGD